MSVQVLEKPSTTGHYNKFCHVVCACNLNLALCGAYKPVQCGLTVINTLTGNSCPRCKKPYCPDCDELITRPCGRCDQ
jgi:hypothetical protein